MNKGAIQRFAIWARNELIAQVSQRAYQYGITKEGCGEANAVTVGGRALTGDEQKQRKELVDQIRSKGYTQVMEEVAYTWFNRFIALRFMEVNNYLPSHIRVFSDSTGAFKPEILSDVLHLDLPGLLMQLRGGLVLVQAKNRAAMEAAWNDDARIEKMIYELNFGAFSKERLV